MKKKTIEFDTIDLQIISLINKKNKINLTEIGKELNLSHVSIRSRLNSLIEKQLININVGINVKKINFKIGLILLEIETDNYDNLIKIYENCPRVIQTFDLIGEYNLGVIFFSENFETFHTILKWCILYSKKGIRKSTILTIGNLIEPPFLNIQISKLHAQTVICGAKCGSCDPFKKGLCLGCINFKHYKGKFKI
ncbi:MAG: winged helix-turn-helix transcriptional regulator [Candidatus Helarchaeota archaeon]